MSDQREVTEFSFAEHGALLPPPDGACEQCAREHEPTEPHDAHSLHYQYWFLRQRGRWPNWGDAMAHIPEGDKAAWRKALRVLGVGDEDMEVPS